MLISGIISIIVGLVVFFASDSDGYILNVAQYSGGTCLVIIGVLLILTTVIRNDIDKKCKELSNVITRSIYALQNEITRNND